MSEIDLKKLAMPFPSGDIEWRVAQAGPKKDGSIFCMVFPYITTRALIARLNAVCGPANWCNTRQVIHELRPGVVAVEVGISIRIGDQWITKYDCSEPGTSDRKNIDVAKTGFTNAMKRAGYQWEIGLYLKHIPELFAETSENGGKGWEFARLPEKQGGGTYYWKPPQLPAWALPKDTESLVTEVKKMWMKKFAPKENNRQALASGFQQFVFSIVGEFPMHDLDCWTDSMLDDVRRRIIASTADGKGPSADVPFT